MLPNETPEIAQLDRSRPFRAEDYSHQPSAYHITDHFRQRMKEPERFLGGDVIPRTIVFGEMQPNQDGLVSFNWCREGDGVQYWFLAGYHEDGYRIAVTAWPYLRDRDAAESCPWWTTAELDTIAAFNERKRKPSLKESYPEYVAWSKANC